MARPKKNREIVGYSVFIPANLYNAWIERVAVGKPVGSEFMGYIIFSNAPEPVYRELMPWEEDDSKHKDVKSSKKGKSKNATS